MDPQVQHRYTRALFRALRYWKDVLGHPTKNNVRVLEGPITYCSLLYNTLHPHLNHLHFFLCLRSMWLPMAINPAASSRDKSTRTGAIMRTMGMDTLEERWKEPVGCLLLDQLPTSLNPMHRMRKPAWNLIQPGQDCKGIQTPKSRPPGFKPWSWHLRDLTKAGEVTLDCKPCIWEVKAGRSGVKGHPWLHRDLEDSLSYKRDLAQAKYSYH